MGDAHIERPPGRKQENADSPQQYDLSYHTFDAMPHMSDSLPTVILRHTLPDGSFHHDWMIARPGGPDAGLVTFRLDQEAAAVLCGPVGGEAIVERLADHRRKYLTFEGPVPGDRGEVRREASGTTTILEGGFDAIGGGVRLAVAWDELEPRKRTIAAVPMEGGQYRIAIEATSSTDDDAENHGEPAGQEAPPMTADQPAGQSNKIQHVPPLGGGPGDVPVAGVTGPVDQPPKIVALGQKKRHEEEWTRTPNTTGKGAIHVRTFHSKLTDDALRYMDRSINEWLDAHPQYEVKFVTSSVGILTGKLKEPHIICQVWV